MTGKRHRPLIDRLLERVGVEGDCWVWQSTRSDAGYGMFTARTQGRSGQPSRMAHRQVWAELVGPIPDGLQLDHLCRNRPCVNPDHLEPVTAKENSRRAGVGQRQRAQKECRNGHPYDDKNTVVNSRGQRGCRRCLSLATMRWKRKRAQA